MKGTGYLAALLLMALSGSGGAWRDAAATAAQDRRLAQDSTAAFSGCMAKCGVMETKCVALEKLYPSCATVDICEEEKIQCETRCRVSARWRPSPPLARPGEARSAAR